MITVNACTGIEDVLFANAVHVFPNPNSGDFAILTDVAMDDLLIEITDLEGRVIYRSQESNVLAGDTQFISWQDAAEGIYLLKLTAKGQTSVQRISVQR